MHWRTKAAIMRICSCVPLGTRLYKWGQKQFGRLHSDPMKRLPMQVKMVHWLNEQGMAIEDCALFEVGTGHIPLVPIGFFLSGAGRIITVDLHRRIDWGLTRDSLEWIANHRREIESIYQGNVVSNAVFDERFATIVKEQSAPQCFLERASIVYLAPMDAANTQLPENSVDCHFSVATLEHIPEVLLMAVFAEAKRILKPTGIAIHFVDLSDHFSHQDRSISSINFLKFSDSEWNRIAGNELAYCNRLRASDYLTLFQDLDFIDYQREIDVDQESLSHLQKKDFPLDKHFAPCPPDDICSTSLRVLLGIRAN